LSNKHGPVAATASVHSDSEDTHASGSVKKAKKNKHKQKAEKKHKHKKSKEKVKDKEKHKESGKGDRWNKRRSRDETSSRRDELEEFLNGSASPPIDAAYEAI
jgi:hypothetical protein